MQSTKKIQKYKTRLRDELNKCFFKSLIPEFTKVLAVILKLQGDLCDCILEQNEKQLFFVYKLLL